MISKRHNKNTKQFMQKILIFIDSVLLNAASSSPEEVNKALINGILNTRDAIFSEIVRDSQIEDLNQFLKQQEESKKNQKIKEEDQKDLKQETK